MLYLSEFEFPPVTILYGGNGSGKTTALNVIAEKLHLQRDTLYNRSSFFEDYTRFAIIKQNGRFQSTAVSLPVTMCLILEMQCMDDWTEN